MKSKSITTVMMLISLFGCAVEETKPQSRVCEPGETQECLCSPGEKGIQVCRTDSSGWGECEKCQADHGSTSISYERKPELLHPASPDDRSERKVTTDEKPGEHEKLESEEVLCQKLLLRAEDLERRQNAVSLALQACHEEEKRNKKIGEWMMKNTDVEINYLVKRFLPPDDRHYILAEAKAQENREEAEAYLSYRCNPILEWPCRFNEQGELVEGLVGVEVNLQTLEKQLADAFEATIKTLRRRKRCAELLNDVNWKARVGIDSSGKIKGELEIGR